MSIGILPPYPNIYQLGPLQFLAERTASNSTSLDFTGIISSLYDIYMIEFINIVPSADADLYMRMSTNNGSSYDSGSNYTNAAVQSNQGTFVGSLNGGAT